MRMLLVSVEAIKREFTMMPWGEIASVIKEEPRCFGHGDETTWAIVI